MEVVEKDRRQDLFLSSPEIVLDRGATIIQNELGVECTGPMETAQRPEQSIYTRLDLATCGICCNHCLLIPRSWLCQNRIGRFHLSNGPSRRSLMEVVDGRQPKAVTSLLSRTQSLATVPTSGNRTIRLFGCRVDHFAW